MSIGGQEHQLLPSSSSSVLTRIRKKARSRANSDDDEVSASRAVGPSSAEPLHC